MYICIYIPTYLRTNVFQASGTLNETAKFYIQIMSITAETYYILASFMLVCELPDDGEIICRNVYE
jgi:hypothetical protein